MPKKISLFNFTPDQIYQKFIQKNLPDVYIGSLYKIHCHTVFLLASTKALDKVLSSFTVYEPKVLVSNTYGNATKLLLELEDKNKIEMNIMHFKYGVTLCISSQVGCNMGCKFCASGVLKKVRNLTSEEMMTQVTLANKILIRTQERITNVVIMGIGEPFDNYANLVKFIKIITYRYGISLGFKHITISTCGICNKILAFAKLFPSVNLTISLHATNDKVRNEIMPINRKWSVKQIMNTIKKYCSLTNNRITIAYLLLNKINDSSSQAQELASMLRNINCMVNLLKYNNIKEGKRLSASTNSAAFKKVLLDNNILFTERTSTGTKINAACGQLRAKHGEK